MKNNRISTAQIAKMCGVSQGTVDRALHNRAGVNEKTKEHILAVAKEYGYRPNKSGLVRLVGIIVFDLYNSYFAELITELEEELRKLGLFSIVMFSDKNKKTERECVEAMYNAGVEAIIICPVNGGEEFSKYLKSWKIPVVTVGNRVDGIKYIGVDDFLAMSDLTSEVLKRHNGRLVYFSPAIEYTDCNNYSQNQRYLGFCDVMEKSTAEYEVATSEKQLEEILTDEDLVIASTDYYAIKVMLSGIAKNCPVVGFDNIKDVEKFRMPMMSVTSDRKKIAHCVAGYVTNSNDQADIIIEHTVVGEIKTDNL